MAAVAWETIEPFFSQAFVGRGQVEREDVINLAFAASASDDVVDAIDALGSRVFRSVDDARAFLAGEGLVS
jgi:hypothetical protein